MPVKSLIKKQIAFLSKQANVLASRLKIRPDRHSYLPGDTVRLEVGLELKKPLDARTLEIGLFCIETRHVQASREMDSYDCREDKVIGVPRSTHLRTTTSVSTLTVHSERKRLAGHMTYESKTYHAEFTIPISSPATRHSYGHDDKKAVWKLEAKLDVPLTRHISCKGDNGRKMMGFLRQCEYVQSLISNERRQWLA